MIIIKDMQYAWNNSGQCIHEGFSTIAKSEGITKILFEGTIRNLIDNLKQIRPDLEEHCLEYREFLEAIRDKEVSFNIFYLRENTFCDKIFLSFDVE